MAANDVDRARLAERRGLWRRFRETGELPSIPADYTAAAARARRQRKTFLWMDGDEDSLAPPDTRRPGVASRADLRAVRWTSETLYQLGAVAA